MRNKFELFVLIFTALLSNSACSLDANIASLESLPTEKIDFLQREQADFIHGEVVTVYSGSRGYQIRGVFGELSEKTQSLNGSPWMVEGVFYE